MFLLLGRAGLLPNSWAMGAAMAVTILYALVADPRPPVVRATILTWMMCIAWSVGREAFSFNTKCDGLGTWASEAGTAARVRLAIQGLDRDVRPPEKHDFRVGHRI